jgi:hypothetical protein
MRSFRPWADIKKAFPIQFGNRANTCASPSVTTQPRACFRRIPGLGITGTGRDSVLVVLGGVLWPCQGMLPRSLLGYIIAFRPRTSIVSPSLDICDNFGEDVASFLVLMVSDLCCHSGIGFFWWQIIGFAWYEHMIIISYSYKWYTKTWI